MLDFEALSSAAMQTQPFRWASVDGMLDPGDAATLSAEWPANDFTTVSGRAQQSYSYAVRPLLILERGTPSGLTPLPPVWQEVLDDLRSPEYGEALSELTGVDLSDARLDASFRRWDEGGHLAPHRDGPEKLITQIIYFETGWTPDRGGCLRILNSADEDDVRTELAPELGTSSVLVRSNDSWHSVTEVRGGGGGPRRSLQMAWMPRGSVPPVFTVGMDGSLGVRREAKVMPRTRAKVGRAARRLGLRR